MDRNGYNPSILSTTAGVCFLCGYEGDTVRHEVFEGNGSRALSKRYGLWVNLCVRCHSAVHAEPQGEWAVALKKIAQAAFISEGHTQAEFIKVFETGNVKWWEL